MSRFLLLLGPSGVGKSEIIQRLVAMDGRFTYISPYMTRKLRDGEVNKIAIDDAQMDDMAARGEFLVVNEIYGIRYATPRAPIVQAFEAGRFPVLDWPVHRLDVMSTAFPGKLFIAYVLPPSIDVLRERLSADSRDTEGKRLAAAIAELESYDVTKQSSQIDLEVVSETGHLDAVASRIYSSYTASL